MPVIGYLSARSPEDTVALVAAFRRGLAEHDLVEGHNVTVEYRWALGQPDRLPALAAELAQRPVAIFVTTGGEFAALAAKAATSTIPIAFIIGGDPVKLGLAAASIGRRECHWVKYLDCDVRAQAAWAVAPVGATSGNNRGALKSELSTIREPTERRAGGRECHRPAGSYLRANNDHEIDAAFDTIVQRRIPALAVVAGPFFDTRRDKLVSLAARTGVPATYHFRDFATAGGLMSYGVNPSDAYHQVGVYAGRILKGAKPADLPILIPTKFELVINLKTAKALGLAVPVSMQLLADEVIE